MRIKFKLNLQALRLLRKELLLLLANCTGTCSLLLVLCSSEEHPGDFRLGTTTMVVLHNTFQVQLTFLNERYTEEFEVSSQTAVSSIVLEIVSPTDFLKFITRDFKENDKNLTFEVKRRATLYYLEWAGQISGSTLNGKFNLNFQPEAAERLIMLQGFTQEAKVPLKLPNLVSTLDSLYSNSINLEIYVDVQRDNGNSAVNFVGQSSGYMIRLEQLLNPNLFQQRLYVFETEIPYQMLLTMILFMKDFKEADMYIDKDHRLLFQAQEERQNQSKYVRLYIEADKQVKEEPVVVQAANEEESNSHPIASNNQ